MSNPLLSLLAQSTQPAEATAELLLLVVVIAWSAGSVMAVIRQRLYVLTPVPADNQTPSAPMLAVVLGAAVAAFIGVMQICALAMGVTEEALKTAEGVRKMMFCAPAANFIAAGVVLALLAGYMPRALHWTGERGGYFRQAIIGYLLALPWVFLVGIFVSLLVARFDPEAKTKHPIFELWQQGGDGVGVFRAVAVFSAVIAAPLGEELVFRGVIQRLVHRLSGNPLLAVVVASVAFAAIHQPWTTRPSIFVLSLFLGWAYFRSGSILVPILMHAIFNLMQFAYFLLIALPTSPVSR